jgi:hypothetical protein
MSNNFENLNKPESRLSRIRGRILSGLGRLGMGSVAHEERKDREDAKRFAQAYGQDVPRLADTPVAKYPVTSPGVTQLPREKPRLFLGSVPTLAGRYASPKSAGASETTSGPTQAYLQKVDHTLTIVQPGRRWREDDSRQLGPDDWQYDPAVGSARDYFGDTREPSADANLQGPPPELSHPHSIDPSGVIGFGDQHRR